VAAMGEGPIPTTPRQRPDKSQPTPRRLLNGCPSGRVPLAAAGRCDGRDGARDSGAVWGRACPPATGFLVGRFSSLSFATPARARGGALLITSTRGAATRSRAWPRGGRGEPGTVAPHGACARYCDAALPRPVGGREATAHGSGVAGETCNEENETRGSARARESAASPPTVRPNFTRGREVRGPPKRVNGRGERARRRVREAPAPTGTCGAPTPTLRHCAIRGAGSPTPPCPLSRVCVRRARTVRRLGMRQAFSHSGGQCTPVARSCGLAPGHDAEVPSLLHRLRTSGLSSFAVIIYWEPRR